MQKSDKPDCGRLPTDQAYKNGFDFANLMFQNGTSSWRYWKKRIKQHLEVPNWYFKFGENDLDIPKWNIKIVHNITYLLHDIIILLSIYIVLVIRILYECAEQIAKVGYFE